MSYMISFVLFRLMYKEVVPIMNLVYAEKFNVW